MTLSTLIATSNTSHSGLRTLSLLITTEYSAWEWYSPIVTFIIILVLPSLLTFITLLVHRVRAARAAQRDRAPEDVVKCLPWQVWTGTGWEKHMGAPPRPSEVDVEATIDSKPSTDEERRHSTENDPSTSHHLPPLHATNPPWFESQHECAICLSSFVKGDHVRILPCQHIFHLDEVDTWLIHRKKLVSFCHQTAPIRRNLRNVAEVLPHVWYGVCFENHCLRSASVFLL
jgi:E3 ubiquitin-protein ligase RNF13